MRAGVASVAAGQSVPLRRGGESLRRQPCAGGGTYGGLVSLVNYLLYALVLAFVYER